MDSNGWRRKRKCCFLFHMHYFSYFSSTLWYRRTTYCKRPLLLSFVELVNLFFKKSSKTVIDNLFGKKNCFTNIFWTIHVRLLRSIKIILIWFNRICLVWKRLFNLFSYQTLLRSHHDCHIQIDRPNFLSEYYCYTMPWP